MKPNKEMTMREFNYSHELKVAMVRAMAARDCLVGAKAYATNNDCFLLNKALDSVNRLKLDIEVALREMEYDS